MQFYTFSNTCKPRVSCVLRCSRISFPSEKRYASTLVPVTVPRHVGGTPRNNCEPHMPKTAHQLITGPHEPQKYHLHPRDTLLIPPFALRALVSLVSQQRHAKPSRSGRDGLAGPVDHLSRVYIYPWQCHYSKALAILTPTEKQLLCF